MGNIFEKIGKALEKGVPGLERVGSGIGDLIARNATPPTVPGMDLSPSQQRGLLTARINDRMIGPNVTRGNEDDFINRIRANNSIAGMQNAMRGLNLDPALKGIINALPPAEMSAFGRNLAEDYLNVSSSDDPSAVREYRYFQGLKNPDGTPDIAAQNRFMALKRANPFINTGSALVQPSPTDPTQNLAERTLEYGPGESPEDQADIERAKTLAGTGLDDVLSPAQKAIDENFAKIYTDYEFDGGRQTAQRNLSVMAGAITDLQATLSPEEQGEVFGFDPKVNPEQLVIREDVPNYSGNYLGRFPTDGFLGTPRGMLYSESVDMADRIAGVIQQGLRDTLGAQFAEREGELMIRRAYDDNQEEAVNIRRLMPLFNLFQQGIVEKNRTADYYQQNGTLVGFEPNQEFNLIDGEGQEGFLNQLFDAVGGRGDATSGGYSELPFLTRTQALKLESGEELTDEEYETMTLDQVQQITDIQAGIR